MNFAKRSPGSEDDMADSYASSLATIHKTLALSRFHIQQVMRRSTRPRSRQGYGSRWRCAGVADCNDRILTLGTVQEIQAVQVDI